MYIICNNCGTTIDFPDYPHQVICSSCNTYLQVEEENDRIVATIIEESEFDNSIFQQQNLPINSHYFGDLFSLMRLESEYDEEMEVNFAYAIIAGKKLRPMLLRGLYRIFFGILFTVRIVLVLLDVDDSLTFWSVTLPCLFLLYSLFLLRVGIRELIKWFRLWRFEREYVREKAVIMKNFHFSIRELSNDLKRNFADFEDNEEYGKALEKEFFYIELFKTLRVYIGSPSLSKSYRIFAIFIPTGFISVFYGFEEFPLAFIYTVISIIFAFFGLVIISNSSTYQETQEKYWKKRERYLDKFKDNF